MQGDLIPDAATWTKSPDYGGRSVAVIEYDRPTSGADDATTAQTIALMQQLDRRDTHAAAVRAAALQILRTLPARASHQDTADAIFRYCQQTVKYAHEDALKTQFSDFANFQYDQTLVTPAALLTMTRPAGDCVDFSMLCRVLCRLFGITAEYKTIAADKNSAAYSHVYVLAQIAPGNWYPLDTSNGPGPGYEFALPRGKKHLVWPDPADLTQRRNRRMIRNRRSAGRLTGEADTGNTDSGFTDIYAAAGVDPSYTGTQYNPGGTATTDASPSAWTSIFSTIAKDAGGIAAPLIRQASIQAPYYITGANGAQILYDPSTGKTANAGSAANRTPAVLSQNILIAAAIGAAVLFAVASKK